MTPYEFITKWRASELKERSASQEHFIDLCRLLGEPTPAEADPSGEAYCFERGARKDTGGDGWADVWKRHQPGGVGCASGNRLKDLQMPLKGPIRARPWTRRARPPIRVASCCAPMSLVLSTHSSKALRTTLEAPQEATRRP